MTDFDLRIKCIELASQAAALGDAANPAALALSLYNFIKQAEQGEVAGFPASGIETSQGDV